MAGRPQLPLGGHGKVRYAEVTSGSSRRFRAYCQFRDLDGRTRQVSATGATKAAAERALLARLSSRSGASGDDITGDTRIQIAAQRWLATIEAAVETGVRSPQTFSTYRTLFDRHLLPAVGSWRLREASIGRIDAVLLTIKKHSGAATAKSCRTVLSGIFGWAARLDAIATNPTRNTSPISVKPRKAPRALTVQECTRWLAQLAHDPHAVTHDLPDLVGFLLGTGVRIGEALAVAWEDVDLRWGVVRVDWTLIRVAGKGLVRKRVKTAAGLRTLRLPQFAIDMLRRRAIDAYALATGELLELQPDLGHVTTLLGLTPVFPDTRGGWRDPSNTLRDLRRARGTAEFAWVTSHVFRKTALTLLDDAGLPARLIADQAGHSQVSMTQDVYMSRKVTDRRAADALEQSLGQAFSMHKPSTQDPHPSEHPE